MEKGGKGEEGRDGERKEGGVGWGRKERVTDVEAHKEVRAQ